MSCSRHPDGNGPPWCMDCHPEVYEKAKRLDDVRAETERAIQQVEEHADPLWTEMAYVAIERTARRLPEFISDDVWEIGALPRTREDRALGPVFLRAKKAGLIVKTDRVRPSIRSHLTGKPVWKSLVYDA